MNSTNYFTLSAAKDVDLDVIKSELSGDDCGFGIEYLSIHRDCVHHVNLFLLEGGGKRHFTWVKNISRFLFVRLLVFI